PELFPGAVDTLEKARVRCAEAGSMLRPEGRSRAGWRDSGKHDTPEERAPLLGLAERALDGLDLGLRRRRLGRPSTAEGRRQELADLVDLAAGDLRLESLLDLDRADVRAVDGADGDAFAGL